MAPTRTPTGPSDSSDPSAPAGAPGAPRAGSSLRGASTLGDPAAGAPPWALPGADVAQRLVVDPERGLDARAAATRLRAHGPNLLRETRATSAWRILGAQLAGPIVALLAVAAGVAFLFGEWLHGAAIVAVLALNALIGFVTELRAVRSMEGLRSLGSVRARVRRDGREAEVPATELVPGDVVLLEAGDVVTADLRLLAASRLEADESALTGESVPVAKAVEPCAADAPLAERGAMLFKGTAVTRGSAESVVVATGMETELGRIARLVQEAEPETTPLEKRLAELGRWLIWVTVLIAALTALLGIAVGKPALLMVETGIALAVAAIPEGLPIVATMALARGMWRMVRRHALVHRLSAVETLGATTVVFTDKTGTLTENRMEVRCVVAGDERFDVAGEGDAPRELRLAGERAELGRHPALAAALEATVLCNNATLGEPKPGRTDAPVAGASRAGVGDPMEVALLALGAAAGVERGALLERLPEVREEAFDPSTLMMVTVHGGGGRFRFAVKGAAEAVLRSCTSVLGPGGEALVLGPAERDRWERRADELAASGLRVLAAARKEAPADDVAPYEELTLLGLFGLADPPRAEVRPALAACRAAGIRVVMVTGDHAGTAASVGRAVGLVDEGAPPPVLGAELDRLGELDEAERRALLAAPIYARVDPEQKLELIAAWQRAGHVVAMTGDGVNDAPALRKADIGVAMGARGTQVAREAADMVLTDDAFASIVAAVEQGRVIFDNIRKFVFYLLSCNVSEVLVVTLATLVGAPLPLLPLQILFLNLVTDVFPALALAFGEGDPDVLRRPPRPPRAPILSRRDWLAILGSALVIGASVLVALRLAEGALGYSRREAVTVSFLTLAAAQLWHVFDVRGRGGPFSNDVVRNPWVWGALALCVALLLAAVHLPGLRTVLDTAAPDARGWLLVLGASLVPLVVGQLWLLGASARRRTRAGTSNGESSLPKEP